MGRANGINGKYREGNQDIFFHPKNAEEIVEFFYPILKNYNNCTMLDACCGMKTLGNAVEDIINVKKSYYVDIESRTDGIIEKDIREFNQKADIIFCNPPFHPVTKVVEIYHHLISILNPEGSLFFVIDNSFLYQGRDRAIEILCDKYYFLPRYTFASAGKPLLDIGILNYQKREEKIYILESFIDITKVLTPYYEYNYVKKSLFD